jgi:hypothetical protein
MVVSRWVTVYLATVGILAAAVVTASVVLFIESGPGDPGESAAQDHGYDIVSWEVRHLPQKWLYKVGALFRGDPELSDEEALEHYFSLGETVQRLERDDAGSDELSEAEAERAGLENRLGSWLCHHETASSWTIRSS